MSPDDLVWHYARLRPDGDRTGLDDRFLSGLRAAIPEAAHQLAPLPLDMLQVGCTSLGFSHDVGSVGSLPVVDAFLAVRKGLELLCARRVILLTPYPVDIARREIAALHGAGVDVVATASMDLLDGYADVTPEAIVSLLDAIAADRWPETDAIVLSCTGWPTRRVLPGIESTTGRPTLSSNLAMVLAALAL